MYFMHGAFQFSILQGFIFCIMRVITLVLLCVVLANPSSAQNGTQGKKPKLMVGIMVDQMKYEFLHRYASNYGTGGFRRLMGEGFVLTNAHYNYAPTVTGPGHASVYTGTTPSVHGVIANDWYDKDLKREVNCVNDPNQKPVGSPGGKGTVSPWRMLSTTMTDELKLSTQKKAKVIGLSVKDRGAVLPAGHLPDGAYWFDSKTGGFITSTYYREALPSWMEKFNSQRLADQYLSKVWNPLLPRDRYTHSGPDENPYEGKFNGKETSSFPYDLKELRAKNSDYELLVYTPFCNDYLTELAKASLDGEKLGQGTETDFLAISYSSTDILGHQVGPNAMEIEDMYVRLDRNIEDLLTTLDKKLGNGAYTVFLTADHGVADIAQYLRDNKIPAGYFSAANTKANLNEYLKKYFPGKELIEAVDGEQIFFNQSAFQNDPQSSGIELMIATELTVNYLLSQEGIAQAYPKSVLRQSAFNEEGVKGMSVRGYHSKRSGDVIMVLEPGWYGAWRVQGTTHGSPYSYDTHVPVIFFGNGVKKGSSSRYHRITDIAPTISSLLNIRFPNGCTGQPVEELLD